MKIAYLLFVTLALSAPASAADLEIKGVRPGMTEAELLAAHPGLGECKGLCYYRDSARQAGDVKSLSTIAGAHVNTWWFRVSRENDKLTSSYAVLPARAGAIVTSAFAEKYGKPTTAETSEFRTGGGLVAEKVTTTWIDGDSVLAITYPYGKITEMKIEIFSKAARDAEIEAIKAKAKKDL